MHHALGFLLSGLIFLIFFAHPNLASSQGTFSVSTDKSTYIIGETATITGTVPIVVIGEYVAIQIFNPSNTIYSLDQVTPAPDGKFSTSVKLGGKLAAHGLYTVKATYVRNSIITTFELTAELKPSVQNIIVESELKDKVFNVLVLLTNGSVLKIDVEPAFKTVTILTQIDPVKDGTLQITLPRDLIDAREGPEWSGADRPFKVFADGMEPKFVETNSTANKRTLEIDIRAGTRVVEIMGTVTVPEFSVGIVIVSLAVGIMVTIIKVASSLLRFKKVLL
ncbi:MAG: hypothetical protein QW769_10365 [Nitrososphaerales archaeon]